MALYEKRKEMPPYLAEIPYGFKNIWRITVEKYDLQGGTFSAAEIQEIFLNGSAVTAKQLQILYDYNRDGCSLTQVGSDSGLYVTLTRFDVDAGVYGFQKLISQSLEISGITSVNGDMVDNTDKFQPYIDHDNQKLDASIYDADKTAIDARIATAETNIENNATGIASLQADTITGITINDLPVVVTDGMADIQVAALTPEQLEARLEKKVDKDVAGTGGTIVESIADSFDADTRTLSIDKTLLSLETGAESSATTSYNLAQLLGITALEAIDKELFYFCNDAHIPSMAGSVSIALSNLYRTNADGSTYIPTTTDNIQIVFGVTTEYSGFNQPFKYVVGAIGRVISKTDETMECAFSNLQRYTIYSRYSGYRTNTIVLDTSTDSLYRTLQEVPIPLVESSLIPITNSLYFAPIKDVVPMPPASVWANFETTDATGKAYTKAETRLNLLDEGAGYDNYISFATETIPSQILTDTDWNAHISLWVTDGMQFTSRSDLLEYLSDFNMAERYKLSNRGIVSTHYESGGIAITPAFTLSTINPLLANIYQKVLASATTGNISVFDNTGSLVDSGSSLSNFATATQGAKADTSIQSITLATGATNGTVQMTVDGTTQSAGVRGLGTAAFTDATSYATTVQGAKADTALQSATLSTGGENGTIVLSTNGTEQSAVAVKGLGTAAFTNAVSYATSAQGAKADTSVQTVAITTGTANGTIQYKVNGSTNIPVSVGGLGTAAYTATTNYATASQGAKADTALQVANVVDNLSSTSAVNPLSANQGRVLEQLIQSVNPDGKHIGGFATYADVYTNTTQYPTSLQPININDTVYIAVDENYMDQPTQYRVSAIDDSGDITYAFFRIVPNAARDFTLNPIQSNEIASGAVNSNTIQNNAIINEDIADGAVTVTKLDPDLQASLHRADSALQSGMVSDGVGAVVSSVTENADKTLTVSYTNDLINVDITGTGDFLTDASIRGTNLTLTKDGTAVKTVSKSGTGNFLTNATLMGKDINFATGTALTSITTSGSGNVVTGISTGGTATLGTAISSITKSGTGNVLTGVSTTGGATTLTSGNAVMSVATSGTGNVVSGITASNGTLTATMGNVVASVPDASTLQKGIVQLNNTLTSSSTTQALTAAQGNALVTLINAADAQNVKLTGNQTVSGTKNFSTHIAVPSKTAMPATPLATNYATEAQVATRIAKPTTSIQNNIVAFDGTGGVTDTGIAYTTIGDLSTSVSGKQNAITTTGILKGNNGTISAAVAGTDYATPATVASQLTNYVPITRTVNAKALNANITLISSDVGADASGTATTAVNSHNGSATSHADIRALIPDIKIFENVSVATSLWVVSSTYADYAFSANIPCVGVTADYVPSVTFSVADSAGGNYAPIALSGANRVTIYVKELPTEDITIPSVSCVKGV